MLLNALVVLILVVANGFFVASEFALVKVREGDLRAMAGHGNRKAARVQFLLSHLDTYLSSCQLGITLASLGLGWVGEPMVASSLGPLLRVLEVPTAWDHYIAFPVAFTLITFLHITLGEQVPKIYAITKYNSVSLHIAHPLHWFTVAFKPFIHSLNVISNMMLRMIGFDTEDLHGHSTTEAELRLLVRESKEGGHVTQQEQRMIENILDLEEKMARRYAVPRHKVVFLDTESTIEDNLHLAVACKHTRIPLCDGGLDRCLGVIHVKELFQQLAENKPITDLRTFAHPVSILPERIRLETLLAHIQDSKQHLALLVDEFGSISGMITLENVLEEVVGSIQDEFDEESGMITWVTKTEAEIIGSCPVERLSKAFRTRPTKTSADTVGGYVTELAQAIPETGETIFDNDFKFTILESSNHTVQRIQVSKKPGPDETGAAPADSNP